VYSEYVAPWRYPDHNMAGMRVGWEAPRTHVGPYLRGDDARILMGGMPGMDAARKRFEGARTPEQTEAVSAELLPMEAANLGDPIDYGAYLVGQLTGTWQSGQAGATYLSNDRAAPLPDFNLDADRGYAYQCWDYIRHASSTPPAARDQFDTDWGDQWLCAPQVKSFLTELAGRSAAAIAADIRAWYGYPEPCTVPQRYDTADNPHHRSRYDPLKRLAHQYLPRSADPALAVGWDGSDLWVSDAEMRAAGMSTTGRQPV
jgi:hypothetical protein